MRATADPERIANERSRGVNSGIGLHNPADPLAENLEQIISLLEAMTVRRIGGEIDHGQ